MDFFVSFGIPLAYLALGIAALSAIVFPVAQMFQDLKKAKTAFIGVGALVIVFLICYALADATALRDATAGQMKVIEAFLYLFYIALAGAVVAIVYSTVSRYFK